VAQESITKVPKQELTKQAKMFFFLLSSSDGLARYCKNLSQWFTHKTAAYYSEQCTVPLLFHNF